MVRGMNRTVNEILGGLNDVLGRVTSQSTVDTALQASLDRRYTEARWSRASLDRRNQI